MTLLENFPHLCRIEVEIRASDGLSGTFTTPTVEQTNVKCWEQNASTREIQEYEKRGIQVTSKIYFLVDPQVTSQHSIFITERNGVTVTSPRPFEIVSETLPDATAGLGVVFKVMANLNEGRLN